MDTTEKTTAELRADLEVARELTVKAWKNYIAVRAVETEAAEAWSELVAAGDYESMDEILWRVAARKTREAIEAYDQANGAQIRIGSKLKRLEASQS